MSTEDRDPDAELEHSLRAELEGLESPPIDSRFRSKLRASFVSGTIARPGKRRASRRGLWISASALAVAATIVLVFTLRVDAAIELGGARDARLVTTNAVSTLSARGLDDLPAGARIETGAESLTLLFRERAVLELAPHSAVTFVEIPRSPAGGAFELVLSSGGLRVATGPKFEPTTLSVRAPDADLRITGTEFGIDLLPDYGTCVCCTRGSVEVRFGIDRARVERIAEGSMILCPPGGADAMQGQVKPAHAAPVIALRTHW